MCRMNRARNSWIYLVRPDVSGYLFPSSAIALIRGATFGHPVLYQNQPQIPSKTWRTRMRGVCVGQAKHFIMSGVG